MDELPAYILWSVRYTHTEGPFRGQTFHTQPNEHEGAVRVAYRDILEDSSVTDVQLIRFTGQVMNVRDGEF